MLKLPVLVADIADIMFTVVGEPVLGFDLAPYTAVDPSTLEFSGLAGGETPPLRVFTLKSGDLALPSPLPTRILMAFAGIRIIF